MRSDLPPVPDLYPEFKDTPRTFWHRVVGGQFFVTMTRLGHPDTTAFAQQLERELDAALLRIAELESKLASRHGIGRPNFDLPG